MAKIAKLDKIAKVFKHPRQSAFLFILLHWFGHMSIITIRTTMKFCKIYPKTTSQLSDKWLPYCSGVHGMVLMLTYFSEVHGTVLRLKARASPGFLQCKPLGKNKLQVILHWCRSFSE